MTSCYSLINTTENFIVSGQQTCGSPVNGISYCCNEDDICLDDAICHSTVTAPGRSGFYVAGCTEPDFPEPCSKSCSELWMNWKAGRELGNADSFVYSRSAVAGYRPQRYTVGLLLSRFGLQAGLLRYVFEILYIYQISIRR